MGQYYPREYDDVISECFNLNVLFTFANLERCSLRRWASLLVSHWPSGNTAPRPVMFMKAEWAEYLARVSGQVRFTRMLRAHYVL